MTGLWSRVTNMPKKHHEIVLEHEYLLFQFSVLKEFSYFFIDYASMTM